MPILDKAALDRELSMLAKQAAELPDGNAAAQITRSMLHILMRSMAVSVQHLAKNAQGLHDETTARLDAIEAVSPAALLDLMGGLEQRLTALEAKR